MEDQIFSGYVFTPAASRASSMRKIPKKQSKSPLPVPKASKNQQISDVLDVLSTFSKKSNEVVIERTERNEMSKSGIDVLQNRAQVPMSKTTQNFAQTLKLPNSNFNTFDKNISSVQTFNQQIFNTNLQTQSRRMRQPISRSKSRQKSQIKDSLAFQTFKKVIPDQKVQSQQKPLFLQDNFKPSKVNTQNSKAQYKKQEVKHYQDKPNSVTTPSMYKADSQPPSPKPSKEEVRLKRLRTIARQQLMNKNRQQVQKYEINHQQQLDSQKQHFQQMLRIQKEHYDQLVKDLAEQLKSEKSNAKELILLQRKRYKENQQFQMQRMKIAAQSKSQQAVKLSSRETESNRELLKVYDIIQQSMKGFKQQPRVVRSKDQRRQRSLQQKERQLQKQREQFIREMQRSQQALRDLQYNIKKNIQNQRSLINLQKTKLSNEVSSFSIHLKSHQNEAIRLKRELHHLTEVNDERANEVEAFHKSLLTQYKSKIKELQTSNIPRPKNPSSLEPLLDNIMKIL